PDRRRHARDERARARRARDGDTSRARRPLHLGVQRGGDRPPAPARPDRGLPREAVHGVRADANGPRHARFRPSRLGVSGPDETRLFTMQRSRTLRYRGRMALTKTISLETAIPGPRSTAVLERKRRVVADPLSTLLPVVVSAGRGAAL